MRTLVAVASRHGSTAAIGEPIGEAPAPAASPRTSPIELYWIPLGAGGHLVRWSGRLYEALMALRERRARQSLYHCALQVSHNGTRYVIEMAPVWSVSDTDRGVVSEGPVGAKWLGRSRWFRYEIRCWPDGRIPDLAEAVGDPLRLADDDEKVARLFDVIRTAPSLTWGRDEIGSEDMWNSNSLVSWLLARAGYDATEIHPPSGGRAPGWLAGLNLASSGSAAG